jgi:DNA-binding NarL/FixJ family response regulator
MITGATSFGRGAPVVRFISIDDHPSISEALGRAAGDYDDLELVGSFISVASVPTPFRRRGEFVDVAVVDLNLPGTQGLSALEDVVSWGLGVLVFSASESSRLAHECLEVGATGYACKSSSTMQVLDGVRRVASGERLVLGVSTDAAAARLTPGDERLLAALTRSTRSQHLAEELHLAPRTIDNLIAELYWKLGLTGPERTRAGLRDWAREHGYGGPASQ